MSTSDPGSLPATTDQGITLPPGVQVGPGRETSQLNGQGIVVQGINFPVTLPNGTALSVFVPNTALGNQQQVAALFLGKINAVLSIPGQS